MSHTIPASAVRRFLAKVGEPTSTGCRLWIGNVRPNTYVHFHISGSYRLRSVVRDYAHRIAWRLHNDQDIPVGMFGCHTCDNPICCNGEHIFLGAPVDNTQDMVAKGRHRGGPVSRFSEADVAAMRLAFEHGETQASLGKRHGVTDSFVSMLINGRCGVQLRKD